MCGLTKHRIHEQRLALADGFQQTFGAMHPAECIVPALEEILQSAETGRMGRYVRRLERRSEPRPPHDAIEVLANADDEIDLSSARGLIVHGAIRGRVRELSHRSPG